MIINRYCSFRQQTAPQAPMKDEFSSDDSEGGFDDEEEESEEEEEDSDFEDPGSDIFKN